MNKLNRSIAIAFTFLLLSLTLSACGGSSKAQKQEQKPVAIEAEVTPPSPAPPPRDLAKEAAEQKLYEIRGIMDSWRTVMDTDESAAWQRAVKGGATICQLQDAWYASRGLLGALDPEVLSSKHITMADLPGVDVEKAKARRNSDLKAYANALMESVEKSNSKPPCSINGEGENLDPSDKLQMAKELESLFTYGNAGDPKPSDVGLTADHQRELIRLGLMQKVEAARAGNKPDLWQLVSDRMAEYNFSAGSLKLSPEEAKALPKANSQ